MALGKMTLAQIRLAAKQRADMENSGFITDAEWNQMINQSYYELYDLLVTAYGNDYYCAPALNITTDGVSVSYPLPDGTLYSAAPAFYKLLGVDLILSNTPSYAITLKPFKFSERNKFNIPGFQPWYNNIRYRLNGDSLLLEPSPISGGQILRMWYVPRLVELVIDADVADGVSGWLEYVIVDAAIKAMQKEESDVSVLAQQKMALIGRINATAENRDAGMPQTVGEARSDDWDNSGFGGWGIG